MAVQTVQLFALAFLMTLCGANSTGGNQDATQTSQAAPNPISMASPESSVTGSHPRPAQLNMMGGGIDEIIADAMKNTMGQGGLPLNNLLGGMNTGAGRNLPRIPAIPRLPMNNNMNSMMSMINPMSLFSGGSGSPFGMMRPMMMMNMMENMFEMFGF